MEVAPAAGPEVRHTLAADAEGRAVLGALGHRHPGLASVEGGHFEGGAERGLRQVDRDLAEEPGALAAKERVLLHLHHHVQVPRRPARRTRLAFAGDA